MLAGRLEGRTIDLNSVFEAVGQVQAGTLDEAGLKAIECGACPTCGSCSGMFTANSMNCLAEIHRHGAARQRHDPGAVQ